MSHTGRESSSANNSLSASLDVPNIGWYRLLMDKRQELITYCQETLIQLQRVSAQWKDQIPAIAAFITSMSQKLELLQRVHPGVQSQSTWSQFFTELKKCVDDLNTFSLILADKKNTTPQIIAAFVERIKTWPLLIKAFNNLELDLIANGLFSSFSTQVANMEEKFSSFSLKKILPPYQVTQLEESMTWLEKNLGDAFSSYPETAQDAILIAASEFNLVFRHAYLMIDKFAAQMDFDLKKLVNEPIFHVGKEATHNASKEEEKGVPSSTLSFHQLATRFREMYSAGMKKAGYTVQEEYYPFPNALWKQRQVYPSALSQQEHVESHHERERWEKVKLECATIIDAQIRELLEEYAGLWYGGKTKQTNSGQLEELKRRLPNTDAEVEPVIQACISAPNDSDVKSTLNKVRAVYANAADRKRNRLAWFERQKQHLQELITEAREENRHAPPHPELPAVVGDIMRIDAPALVAHTRQLIATFSRSDNTDSKETMVGTVLEAVQQCEVKLQEILDPRIYSEWFDQDWLARVNIALKPNVAAHGESKSDDLVQLKVEVNHSWLFRLAQLIKKIKLLAVEAKKMQTKSAAGSKSTATPGQHFQGTIRQLDTTVVSLTTLMKTFNELRDNPVIQKLPPLGTVLSNTIPTIQNKFRQTVVAPLSNHPLQQAWNDRNDFASQSDKLKGGLQNLRRVFLSLLDKSAKSPAIKQIANHGLEQADELLDAFQNTKSMTAFLFDRPRQLYRFIKSAADVFTTLLTLSGDELLLAAKMMNDALRQLFLLFDKLEIQFYLKENYLAKLISVNDQSLLELGKLFSDTLKQQGYVFKPEECFPYTHAILAERRQLLREAVHPDPITERFINNLINKSVNDLAAEKAAAQQELNAQKAAYKASAIQKLRVRRQALLDENKGCFTSATKTQKADLLQRLIRQMQTSDAVGIQVGSFSYQERERLRDGRTGNLLNTLLFFTKEELTLGVRNLIGKIRNQQKSCCGLFSSRQSYQQKIQAVEALQRWLDLPGFRINDAMKELKEHDFATYQILDKNKKELLTPLRDIEKHIPDFVIGKKVIAFAGNADNAQPDLTYENLLPASASVSSGGLFDDADVPASLELRQPLLLRA